MDMARTVAVAELEDPEVIALVVASVAAQAMDLTPVAIVLLIGAVCALAPLFAPAIDV